MTAPSTGDDQVETTSGGLLFTEVREGGELPCAAAVMRAASSRGDAVVLVAPELAASREDIDRAVEWLARSPELGAVVPRVLRPDGRLAEAGAIVQADGTLRSSGYGQAADRSEHSFVREVDGTRFGCVAIRRRAIAELAIDPELDEPAAVAMEALAWVRAAGLTVLYDPNWTVGLLEGDPAEGLGSADREDLTPARTGHRWVAARDASRPERILIVTGSLSGQFSPWSDGGIHDLVDAVRTACPAAAVAVASAEGSGRSHPAEGSGRSHPEATLRAAGIEVAAGPSDWSQWFADRAYHYSHVVVTDGGLTSGLADHVFDSQPQAAKVWWTGTLPFRPVEGMLPVTPYPERAGHEYVRCQVASAGTEIARRFDSLWCENEDDFRYLSGLLEGVPVRLLPRPLASETLASGPLASGPLASRRGVTEPGFAERHGFAVMASPGADIVAGHEDSAVCAAEEIFAPLHQRDRRLVLRVITAQPSPMVRRLADQPGVLLEAPDAAGPEPQLERARVVLAPYRHGIGGRAALAAAMAAGTPFLASSTAAQGVVLGDLRATAVAGDPLGLVERAWSLHADRQAWDGFRLAMAELVESEYCRQRFVAAVGAAFLELGIRPRDLSSRPPAWAPPTALAPPSGGPRPETTWGRSPAGDVSAASTAAPGPPLRPVGFGTDRASDGAEELSETERYRLWCRRRGPTASLLERLRADLADLPYQPSISIVTPVFNTDPRLLETTIAAVRDQIYGNWELCLADDGSTREDTRAVLAAVDDARIRVSYLPAQSGIVGASNAALATATGEYVAFMDHDDLLKPHALAQVVRWLNADPALDLVYSDEDKLDDSGELDEPYLKPDWSPDLLMSRNYVNHLLVVRRSLVEKVGGFRAGFDGSQDYDLLLRLTEMTDRIGHIPEPLYTWRRVAGSTAAQVDAKPYAFDAARRALTEALVRRGQVGTVEPGLLASTYHTRYAVPGEPRVSIVIPTRDRVDFLRRCVNSVLEKTAYRNYEIVVIDNQSRDPATLEYLATFPGRVLRYPSTFNYARMLNLAAHTVSCDALLFLNNDTEVMSGDWVDALLEHAMRPEVGAVGCRLYYPDGRLQHEGILVGILGVAANVDHGGFWALGDLVRNTSAVTGACVMMRPAVYWAIGGNDERLRVAYNDVDICLRIRQAGYRVVYTPYARLTHFEGASRAGFEHADDRAWFSTRWRQFEEWDPYYGRIYDRNRLYKIKL